MGNSARLDVTRPAVVLGVEHPRGLAVLRSLGAAGVKVDVVDRYPYAPGLYSKHAHRTHFFDTDDAERTLAFLEAMVGVDQAVLIPTNDHYLQIVSSHRDRLARRFAVTFPGWDLLEPALDKARLYKLATAIGLRAPVFFVPESADQLDHILTRLEFGRRNYVFSVPPTSRVPAETRDIRLTVPAGPDLASARRVAADLTRRCGPPMVQEVVPGGASDCFGVVMLVDDHGRAIGHRVVRRRKLYRYFEAGGHWYGGNVHCESAHDDEAVAATATLVEHTKLTGVVTVEFRRRPSDGALVLMKIDPRVVGMTGLCTALGFDVATLLYRLHTGQPMAAEASYPDGVSWVWEKPYLFDLANSGLREALRELPGRVSALRRASVLGIWSRSDPWPFIWNAAGGVRSQVRRRFEREQSKLQSGPPLPDRPAQ